MGELTHIDKNGKAVMVDVTEKLQTIRTAEAVSEVHLSDIVFTNIKNNLIEKGDVLSAARIAGIQAAKKTYELIPLCHNIFISKIDISFELIEEKKTVKVKSFAKTDAKTGIEMEALTAVSIAALTIYDMCKALDKSISITGIKLISKTGGKSGDYFNPEAGL
jgi:molybdenum cofactor biosynthesis protein MoaC